jgi:hypothetical protein
MYLDCFVEPSIGTLSPVPELWACTWTMSPLYLYRLVESCTWTVSPVPGLFSWTLYLNGEPCTEYLDCDCWALPAPAGQRVWSYRWLWAPVPGLCLVEHCTWTVSPVPELGNHVYLDCDCWALPAPAGQRAWADRWLGALYLNYEFCTWTGSPVPGLFCWAQYRNFEPSTWTVSLYMDCEPPCTWTVSPVPGLFSWTLYLNWGAKYLDCDCWALPAPAGQRAWADRWLWAPVHGLCLVEPCTWTVSPVP